MAEMSMNRVIHNAVRRDLDRFVGALSTFRDGDAARADQLGRAWEVFDAELVHHHEGEHEIAWPALQQVGVPAQTLDEMDAEHDVMAAALGRARAAMAALQARPGAEEATLALRAVQELREVTVAHLDHEEREVEPVYLAHQDSPAIKEMGRRFARAQSLPKAGRFFAWVTDGASEEERTAAHHGIPGPVRALLGFFGRGYRRDVAPVWH